MTAVARELVRIYVKYFITVVCEYLLIVVTFIFFQYVQA